MTDQLAVEFGSRHHCTLEMRELATFQEAAACGRAHVTLRDGQRHAHTPPPSSAGRVGQRSQIEGSRLEIRQQIYGRACGWMC